MSKIVLDASALLAVLNAEPGSERITPELLSKAVISTVNLAEVQAKLVDRGIDPDLAWTSAHGLVREAVDFSAEHAKIAGDLILETRPLGLSLGDRACLALGLAEKCDVYTADKNWKGLKLVSRIHMIR